MRAIFSICILLITLLASASSLKGQNTISNHHAMKHRTCKTPGCIKAAQGISKYIDAAVNPCDNFYRFVCGNYTHKHTYSSSIFGTAGGEVSLKIEDALQNKIVEDDSRTLILLKSHYNVCLKDVLNLEKYGKSHVEKFLNIVSTLGGWPVLVGESWDESAFEWKNLVYQLRRNGYIKSMNSLLAIGVGIDEKNNTRNLIDLDQPDLVIGEFLMKGFENEVVQAYYKYMVDIAVLLGVNKHRAKKELHKSLIFEMQLSQISSLAQERRNKSQLYNPMTVEELQSKYPDIPWEEYINEFLQSHYVIGPNEYINVANPNYLKSVTELIAKTPKRVLANYMFWRMIQESTPFLNKGTRDAVWEFMMSSDINQIYGCAEYVVEKLPLAAGALYVRKLFNTNLKKGGEKIIEDLRKSFHNILEKVNWMDAKTKRNALKKLKSIHVSIAYPDELLDDDKLDEYYKDLKEFPNSYLDSYLSINLFDMNKACQNLQKPYNRTGWTTYAPSTATFNAYYNPPDNSIIVPAAFFQEVTLALDRPNYVNYGIFGTFLGHEFTHAFDDEGSQYNEKGNLINWWDRKTQKEYLKRAQCIIDQYSNYTVECIDIKLNGIKTQGENIADNGGFKLAYLTYEEYEKEHGPEPRLPGLPYSPRQLFWISNAYLWCESWVDDELTNTIISETHSPGEFRVIGSFSNTPEFARDFECPLGSPMNPIKKCTVW